jgi:hypothetical protein
VHPRRLHPVDRPDRPGQFALEGAEVIEVLDEGGRAQAVGPVEQLVAERAAARDALLGHGEAQPEGLVLRNEDLRAVRAQLERHLHLLELRHDAARIVDVEVAEQQRLGGRGEPARQHQQAGEQAGRDDAHQAELRRAEPAQRRQDAVHATPLRRLRRALSARPKWANPARLA